MKTAVIYKSNYGSTKQYAQWLSTELQADLIENVGLHLNELATYDTIVYGAGLYAGNLNGIKIIADNMGILKGKQIVIFTVGIGDPGSPGYASTLKTAMNEVFTPEDLEQIKVFHLRGDIDYSKLSPIHRTMMFVLKTFLRTKKSLSADDRSIVENYGKATRYVDKASITPIVEYCMGL